MKTNIQKTTFYQELESRNEEKFIGQIDNAYRICTDILPKINKVFNNYTMHNEVHSLNVMKYMSSLITNISEISSLDIVLCIYSALFHDIGMVVFEDEIDKIKNNSDPLIKYDFDALLKDYGNETVALQEAIRPIHGKRVKVIFERGDNELKNLFYIPDTTFSFKNELIDICQAHNEDFEWIKAEMHENIKKGIYDANPQFVAVLLRLADLLDIDEQRAPRYLYQLLNPSGISDEEWRQHFILDNIDKVVNNSITGCKEIQLYGRSTDVKIHRKFLHYIDYLKDELARAIIFSENFRNDNYVLKINAIPKLRFETPGFSFADFKLSLDYNAVTNLLMGENIYGDKKYGLRELLQNSIDACKVLNELSKKDLNPYDEYKPKITITMDQERNRVSIFDNGIGMSLEILKNYFLNIGVSYYKSKDYRFMGYDYKPIGNYGIGFLACFMLSQEVKIVTRQYGENKANTILINRDSEYVCVSIEEIQFNNGTEIILNYNEFMKVFKNIDEIKNFIKVNFIADDVTIVLNDTKNKVTLELKSLANTIQSNISLSNYLNDVEIYVDFKFSKGCFFKKIKDLTGNNSYYYSEGDYDLHSENEEEFNLYEYVDDDQVKFLKVAIVEDSDSTEFNTALNYLDNYEEALDKIEPSYITIVYKEGQDVGSSNIGSGDAVIEDFYFDNLVSDFGQADDAIAYISDKTQKVVMGEGDTYLGFEIDKQVGEYSWRSSDEVYCKNVLVSNAHLTIPYILNGLKINQLVMNSKHANLIPTVTRNDFPKELKKELSYAVGKAIHQWILDNVELNLEEAKLIRSFVQKYYSEKTRFIRNN